MSAFEAIEVRVDLHRACDRLAVPGDARALLTVLFNAPWLSTAEAAVSLGWSMQRLDRVTRSLRPDRALGDGLRSYLGAYQKNKSAESVREIDTSAA